MRQFVDRVLVVDCDEQTQLTRLLARDAENEGQARLILAAQANRQDRLAIADDIIYNDADIGTVRSQVNDLHNRYLRLPDCRE